MVRFQLCVPLDPCMGHQGQGWRMLTSSLCLGGQWVCPAVQGAECQKPQVTFSWENSKGRAETFTRSIPAPMGVKRNTKADTAGLTSCPRVPDSRRFMAGAELNEPKGSPVPATFSKVPREEALFLFLSVPFSLLEESKLRELKRHMLRNSSSTSELGGSEGTPDLPVPTPLAPISGNGTSAVHPSTQAKDLGLSRALSSHPICHLVPRVLPPR